ncbi:hypothetical protein GcC1_042023 [Golovinomyces cichoracearum]|uniref:Uncharacterized protein n=1 Tax=Golovinomyces cichoracearum TaxID=62708 RepID=A0A420IZ84_9PEZI|nr:hypothetical protein GcC1_042023 [Golovinomyces cichoracearum]
MSAYNDKNLETPHEQLNDDDLWEKFQEDFKNWRLEDFKVVPNQFIIALRKLLKRRGVIVQKGRGYPIAQRLYDTIHQKDQLQWTEEEINEKLISDTSNFDSRYNPKQKNPNLSLILEKASGVVENQICQGRSR